MCVFVGIFVCISKFQGTIIVGGRKGIWFKDSLQVLELTLFFLCYFRRAFLGAVFSGFLVLERVRNKECR